MFKQSSLVCGVLVAMSAAQLSAQSTHSLIDGHNDMPFYIGAGALSGAVLFALMLNDHGSSQHVFTNAQTNTQGATGGTTGSGTPGTGTAGTGTTGGSGNLGTLNSPSSYTGDGSGQWGDDGPVTTPEPGTVTLIATGFVGVAGALRRRSVKRGTAV